MLFKSQPENFNPQIHTEELSLAVNMDKSPAVHNKVLSRFERYTKMTSFLYHTGRVNGGAKNGMIKRDRSSQEVYDNAYRVQKRTINIPPAYTFGQTVIGGFFDPDNSTPDMTDVSSYGTGTWDSTNGIRYIGGTGASTIATDTIGSIAIKHEPDNQIWGDKFNPTDTMELDAGLGTELLIVRKRFSSSGDHYIYDFKTIGKTSDWTPESLKEGEVMMEGGSRFGEGSLKGNQRFWGTTWDIFYSFISRYSLSFTGDSLSQKRVVWTDKTVDGAHAGVRGNGFWQFEAEWEADQMFSIMLELACRYSKTSMDASTHKWFESSGKNMLTMSYLTPEFGITPPRTSDGWITSIKDTLDFTYDVNTGPTIYTIEGIMDLMAGNSPAGQQGNTFILLTDTLGHRWWNYVMKRYVGINTMQGLSSNVAGHSTDVVQNIATGANVKLGFNVTSYEHNGNEIIVMVDELMSHPGLVGRNGGFAGRGDMIFLNVTPFGNGVSNFELFSKGNGRLYKKKYVDGMHSLSSGKESIFASSGFDGAFVHILAELFPITYFENTSCILRGTGKFNGGALSGISGQLGSFPQILNQ